jgi:hypothetical protein
MSEDEIYQYNINPFYKSLQTRYKKQFEIVQEQNGLVCIPLRNITEERLQISSFVLKHLYIPSPFLKNQYYSISNQDFDILMMENSFTFLVSDKALRIKTNVKILGEQTGYDIDNKSYRIIIIEYPLLEYKESSFELSENLKNKNEINEVFTYDDVSKSEKIIEYLQKHSYSTSECFKNEIKIFKETYVVLCTFLDAVEQEVLRIHKKYFEQFLNFIHINEEILSIAIENYLNGCFYNKIWPIITNYNSEKDNFINFKLNQINKNIENGSISYYLKLNNKYLIDYNLSIKEISRIHLLKTAFEKLICMKTCLDLISTELLLFYKVNDHENTFNEHDFKLTSDELLPLTCYVIIKAKLSCLYSLIFFTEKFNLTTTYALNNSSLYLSSLNELSFVLSTFKAATGLIEHYI